VPIVGSLRSEVPGLARLKTIARWVSSDPFMLPPEAGWLAIAATDAIGVVYEYFNLFFLLDANAVYFGAAELQVRGASLVRVVAAMGEIDSAISVASLRAGSPAWTRPHFRPAEDPSTFENARHPLLDAPVPNSIELGPPYGLLVTGSNMSGKATFLRTLGVTTIMAQTIGTCFATRYAAPMLQVRSCIGRSDDLIEGKSYYVAEVEAVLSLVRASESIDPHLFLFDELFRGTNAVERVAGGEAVLRHLTATAKHLVVAATHDSDLVDLLADRCVPCHFTDRLGPDGLEFDYRLSEGPATTRNAIALLKLHGAPEDIISGAIARTGALDRERARSG
jgi:DNA mismatch repair ATPase MutS